MSELELTPEEQVKQAMLDPAYRDQGNWRHEQAVQRVRELARAAWPEPTPPPSEVSAPSVETSTPVAPGPMMVLTGRAGRLFREAQQRALWREYMANPAGASPELRARIWTPAAVRGFVDRVTRKWR